MIVIARVSGHNLRMTDNREHAAAEEALEAAERAEKAALRAEKAAKARSVNADSRIVDAQARINDADAQTNRARTAMTAAKSHMTAAAAHMRDADTRSHDAEELIAQADQQMMEAAAKLAEAEDDSDEYQRAIYHYTQLVRHRMANPLQTICGMSQTLDENPNLDRQIREQMISDIHKQAQVLARVCLDARVISGEEYELQPRPFED